MTNEWTQAQDSVIDTLREETIARIERHYTQTGEWLNIDETYDRVCEQFIKGLQYLIADTKEDIVTDVDQMVTMWGDTL